MAAVERLDDLVRDYLLYRGFTGALKSFESDVKSDKDKGFRVDRVVDQLMGFVWSYDIAGLRVYWDHLDRRVFSHLEFAHMASLRRLEVSVLRLYLVNAIQTGHAEKVSEFFNKYSTELQNQTEWKDWFVLPYIKNPEQNATFEMYFTKQWQETLTISLNNFFSIIYQSMPLPTLLNFDRELQKIVQLEEENKKLKLEQKITLEQSSGTSLLQQLDVTEEFPPSLQNEEAKEKKSVPSSTKGGSKKSPNPKTARLEENHSGTLKAKETTQPQPAELPTLPEIKKRQQILKHNQQRQELLASRSLAGAGGGAQPPTETDPGASDRQGVTGDTSTREREAQVAAATAAAAPLERESGPPDDDGSETAGVGSQELMILSQEEYTEHRSSISAAKVSAQGTVAATCDADGVVKVWSFSPLVMSQATIMLKAPIFSLEWAVKHTHLLLLGGSQNLVRLYDTENKKTLCDVNFDDAFPQVVSLACNPGDTQFVGSAASQSDRQQGKVLCWDMKTTRLQQELPAAATAATTQFNHNGQLLLTGDLDGTLKLFDMQTYACFMSWHAHDGEIYSAQFSPDENYVYSMGADGKFCKWSIHQMGKRVADLSVDSGTTGPFYLQGYGGYKKVMTPRGKMFAFDTEGRHVLTCGSNGGVIYKVVGETRLVPGLYLGGHLSQVVTVDWYTTMNYGTCLTGSMNGSVKVSTLMASSPDL